LHTLSTSFVLGYHGCDRDVGEAILGGAAFKPSKNDYDWLGSGIYFWESNPKRGLEFVKEIKSHPKSKDRYKNPFVVGAVIDLGKCLDLSTQIGIENVKSAYHSLKEISDFFGDKLPENQKKLRRLDCAVINHLHEIISQENRTTIDTIKGIFIEGDPIYDNASFHEKTHIQICVCKPECIKGVFRVKDTDL
jgi:hypothetical protein